SHFAGRPILMLNGKEDRIVPPDAARLLFDLAPEPKQQRWYDSGHPLPAKAFEDAAAWAAEIVTAAREKPKDKRGDQPTAASFGPGRPRKFANRMRPWIVTKLWGRNCTPT